MARRLVLERGVPGPSQLQAARWPGGGPPLRCSQPCGHMRNAAGIADASDGADVLLGELLVERP